MQHRDRTQLLEGLASGRVPLSEVAGLTQNEIDRMSAMGRVAYESRMFEKGAMIFGILETLQATEPEHSMRLAHCLVGAGLSEPAVRAIDRYLDHDITDPAALVRALILRASLMMPGDREAALRDIEAAHILGQEFETARVALEAGGR